MNVIVNFDVPESVIVTGVRVFLACKKCSGLWTVMLNSDFTVPHGGFICQKCLKDEHKEGAQDDSTK